MNDLAIENVISKKASMINNLLELALSDDKQKNDHIIELLGSSDGETIKYAVFVCASTGNEKYLEPILYLLSTTDDQSVRKQCILSLSEFKNKKVIAFLLNRISRKNIQDVWYSLTSLNEMDPWLIRDFKDDILYIVKDYIYYDSSRIREKSIQLLSRVGDSSDAALVIPLLNDRSRNVRRAAAEVLGKLHDQSALTHLCLALGDRDIEVVLEVVKSLSNYPVHGLESIFAGLLMDKTPLNERFPVTYRFLTRMYRLNEYFDDTDESGAQEKLHQMAMRTLNNYYLLLKKEINKIIHQNKDIPLHA